MSSDTKSLADYRLVEVKPSQRRMVRHDAPPLELLLRSLPLLDVRLVGPEVCRRCGRVLCLWPLLVPKSSGAACYIQELASRELEICP